MPWQDVVYSPSQIDALLQGLSVKAPCRVATTANITLSGAQTIDGVSVIAGDRVLVKNQSTASQNGIYVCASGAWSRATDADAASEVKSGLYVLIEEGTTNGDTSWVLTTNNPITLGSTSLVFTQFNALGQVTAGAGLTKTGATLAIDPAVVPTDAGATLALGLDSQAAGDLLVASSASAFTRLAKGANNSVLGVDNSGALGYLTTVRVSNLGIGGAPVVPLYNQNSATYRGVTTGQRWGSNTVLEDGANGILIGFISSEYQIWMHSGVTDFTGADLALAIDLSGNMRIPKGYIEFSEISAPANAAANKGRLFMEDNGSGKTRLMAIFPSGAKQQIAIEP